MNRSENVLPGVGAGAQNHCSSSAGVFHAGKLVSCVIRIDVQRASFKAYRLQTMSRMPPAANTAVDGDECVGRVSTRYSGRPGCRIRSLRSMRRRRSFRRSNSNANASECCSEVIVLDRSAAIAVGQAVKLPALPMSWCGSCRSMMASA